MEIPVFHDFLHENSGTDFKYFSLSHIVARWFVAISNFHPQLYTNVTLDGDFVHLQFFSEAINKFEAHEQRLSSWIDLINDSRFLNSYIFI